MVLIKNSLYRECEPKAASGDIRIHFKDMLSAGLIMISGIPQGMGFAALQPYGADIHNIHRR